MPEKARPRYFFSKIFSLAKIVDYIRGKGEATIEEMVENLNLAEGVLRREFAVLRHMEILKATKKGDKIVYILF